MADKLDLYLLTGFLGAGKTTVLRHILELMQHERVGILQHEFCRQQADPQEEGVIHGREDILLRQQGDSSLVCACPQALFPQALADLAQHPMGLRYVFAEGSGLGDPASMEAILQEANALCGDRYQLKGILCLVDANNFMDIRSMEPVVWQLRHCHLAILNKADLVAPELLGVIQQQVRRINPDCGILACSFGQFNLDFLEQDLLAHQWSDEDYAHESDIALSLPLFLYCRQPVPRAALTAFLREMQREVYRMKGAFLLENGWHQVDAVGSRIDFRLGKLRQISYLMFLPKEGPAITEPIQQAWDRTVGLPMELKYE